MKILITGGAGFIGSHIAEEAIKKGHEVTVIDNLTEGTVENLDPIRDEIRFVEEDIRDVDVMEKLMSDVDAVSHQAALRSVPASFERPYDFIDVNMKGHFTVLDQARKNDVTSVVFASSSSVYGNADTFPQKESFRPDPISPYAVTKLGGEGLCKTFHERYGLNTISLRYFNVFGPRQDPESQYAGVIPIFIRRISAEKNPVVHWDGEQSRDFTYVKDVANVNLKAAIQEQDLDGEVFNVSKGETISINQLWKEIAKILEKDVKPEYEQKRPGDVRKSMGSPKKLKVQMDFTCAWSFEEGLKKTIHWFQNNSF